MKEELVALSDYDEFTWLATIVGVHGIAGAVRAKYYTDNPEYYLDKKFLFLENSSLRF